MSNVHLRCVRVCARSVQRTELKREERKNTLNGMVRLAVVHCFGVGDGKPHKRYAFQYAQRALQIEPINP